jgi:hypothetical protein
MRHAWLAYPIALILWASASVAQSDAPADVQSIVDNMVRLCLGGGSTQAITGAATGGTDISLRDVKGNLKGEFKINKSIVEGLSNGIDNALTQVAADQADKVRDCLKPVRDRLLDLWLPAHSPSTPDIPSIADIGGLWRDNFGTVFHIVQQGNAFRVSAQGTSCRGSYFQSSGFGTITRNNVVSTYRSTVPSAGRCEGTISANGMEINTTCSDQVCGVYKLNIARQ